MCPRPSRPESAMPARPPDGGFEQSREVDVVRDPALLVVGAMAGYDLIVDVEDGLGTVEEGALDLGAVGEGHRGVGSPLQLGDRSRDRLGGVVSPSARYGVPSSPRLAYYAEDRTPVAIGSPMPRSLVRGYRLEWDGSGSRRSNRVRDVVERETPSRRIRSCTSVRRSRYRSTAKSGTVQITLRRK